MKNTLILSEKNRCRKIFYKYIWTSIRKPLGNR